MAHHINADGQFQSDRHPDLPPDKIVLSFKDPLAWAALSVVAAAYEIKDPELSADIRARVEQIMTTGLNVPKADKS